MAEEGLRACLIGVCLIVAFGCGGPSSPISSPGGGAEIATSEGFDGHARLPEGVSPSRYALDLAIDPTESEVSGTVTIDLVIASPRERLTLHARELTIRTTRLIIEGARHEVRAVPGPNGGLTIVGEDALPAGSGTLTLSFTGRLPEVPEGLYRVEAGGAWYAFTQFEPLEARASFPCFDEPRFKTPFEVSLRAPEGLLAFANAPETSRAVDAEGWTRFTFAPTRPLPTYLVAFAVGDFEVVEAPAPLRGGAPLRVITRPGQGHLAEFALSHTAKILDAQVTYFGSDYPYQKLDLIAVPNFAAGAMENVGLVTFRERLLLIDEATAAPSDQIRVLGVIAHELAHMWFGNLVTLAWWNDIWLNEAFATWMASRTIEAVYPELESALSSRLRTRRVMSSDSQRDARAVRQPIETGGDVYNAFDGITYSKGAAILWMVERWLGEAVFRDAVRAYLEGRAHGVATTADLMAALRETTGKDLGEMLSPLLDQPGVPMLAFSPRCVDGRAEVTIAQSRYHPLGLPLEAEMPWRLPVCMRLGGDEPPASEVRCVLLERAEQTFPLERCPAWLHPNADANGYYRWTLPAEALRELVANRGALSLPERVTLAPDLDALLEAGLIDAGMFLEATATLADGVHRLELEAVIKNLVSLHEIVILERLADGAPGAKADAERYAAHVRALISPHLERVGLEPRDEESIAIRRLRPALIRTLLEVGHREDLIALASSRAHAFIEDPESVPTELARIYLGWVVRDGDDALWRTLREAFDGAGPTERETFLRALAGFHDPELLRRTFAMLLDGTLYAQDAWAVLGAASGDPVTRDVAWAWFSQEYDGLVALIGERSAPSLPWIGAGACSQAGADRLASFFEPQARRPSGTDRKLRLAVERVEQCARLREATTPGVRAFLSAQP